MKHALIIFVFTAVVTLFYNHVGQLVPQKEVPAPEAVDVSGDLSTGEMVAIGEKIVNQKCMTCHSVQPRFPALDGIGGRAGSTKDGVSDLDYLAEALYEPNAFIVESFAAGMTPANKPPLNLSDSEILTVIAYLQSLGGTPSVTMSTKLKYQSEDSEAPKKETSGGGDAAPAAAEMTGPEMMTAYACQGCHALETPDRMVGPSLYDTGTRLSKAEIYEAIMEPDATVAEGFPGALMGATLGGTGFYDKVSSKQLKVMVDYLASLKGKE